MSRVRSHVRSGRPVRSYLRSDVEMPSTRSPRAAAWTVPEGFDPREAFDEIPPPPAEAIEIVWVPTEWLFTPGEQERMRHSASYGEEAEVPRHLRRRFESGLPVDPAAAILVAPNGRVEVSMGWHRIYTAARLGLSRVPIALAVADPNGEIDDTSGETGSRWRRPPFDPTSFVWWRHHRKARL